LPHLAELAGRFEDQPVSVVSVLQGKRTRRINELIEESGATGLVYSDGSGDASDAYGVRGVPTTVIIDETGRVMFRHVGFDEGMEEQFAAEIEMLLAWMVEA
jgi:hypothetical protein